MMSSDKIDYFCIGGLRTDYCITHDGQVLLGVMGGNAIYATTGAMVWSSSVGIVSRVGCNYPQEWLEHFTNTGIDISGIHVLDEPHDTTTFYAYITEEERIDTNPAAHFLRIGHPIPKELLDYQSSTEHQDKKSTLAPLTIRPMDIPESARRARGVHLSPAHYLTHMSLPVKLREYGIPIITLDPSTRYMEPSFLEDLSVILHGLDAFIPSENEARVFFRPSKPDVWEMAETFGNMGSRFVVIKSGANGQFVWDSNSKRRWHIPAFPSNLKNVTGAGDSYCGGFLTGLAETENVIEAALRGSVSASIAIEGIGPMYTLEAMEGLAEARLESLKPAVREI
jgi:sugar/nucleoside kinase (ribokinase family)